MIVGKGCSAQSHSIHAQVACFDLGFVELVIGKVWWQKALMMAGFRHFFTTISVLFALSELEPVHIKFSG
jgi:hypothetical protein